MDLPEFRGSATARNIKQKTDVIQFSPRFVKNPILSDFLIGNASQEYNH